MRRVHSRLLAGVVPLLAALPLTAQEPPPRNGSGDVTSPALLQFLRQRFARTDGLRAQDGIALRETRFFRGRLVVSGTVARQGQVEEVRRALQSLRPDMEAMFDLKLTAIDVSGLSVQPAGKQAEPGKFQPGRQVPGEGECPVPSECAEEGFPMEFEGFAGFVPAPEQPSKAAAKHRRRGHKRSAQPTGAAAAAWEVDEEPDVNAFTDPRCLGDCKHHLRHGKHGKHGHHHAPPPPPAPPWCGPDTWCEPEDYW
jgi:hypothetical protein